MNLLHEIGYLFITVHTDIIILYCLQDKEVPRGNVSTAVVHVAFLSFYTLHKVNTKLKIILNINKFAAGDW